MLRALVAEEEGRDAVKIASVLPRYGFEVTTAPSGVAALSELQKHAFSLVICDIRLPDMDGFALLRRVHQSKDVRGIPIILMAPSGERAAEAIMQGAADFLVKPYDTSRLSETIESLLGTIDDRESRDDTAVRQPSRSNIARLPHSARYVRGLRLWLDLPQDRFANIIGYRTKSISKWESGQSIAFHAFRTLQQLSGLRDDVVRLMGWRASQEWLRTRLDYLGGKTPTELLEAGNLVDVCVAARLDIPMKARAHHEKLDGSGYPYKRDTQNASATTMMTASGSDTELQRDLNYRAFLRDAPMLEREYPGHIVAYADGNRVALGRDTEELVQNLPIEHKDQPLFVKDLPDTVVEFRRPLRVVEP